MLGSRHTAGEDNRIQLIGTVELDTGFELIIGHVRHNSGLVRSGYEFVAMNRDSLYIYASPTEDVKWRKRFHFLETVGQKNIYAFHNIIK